MGSEMCIRDSPPQEQVLVTASRLPQQARPLPMAWSQVAREDLALTGHVHINEVMQRVPGAWISRGNGQESLPSLRSPVLTGAGSCGAFFMAADGITADMFYESEINGAIYNGSTYLLPLPTGGAGSILWYNKDMYEEAGLDPASPPQTWAELEEAAKVFGCTPLQAFRQVVLPLVLPGIAAAAIFTFVMSWTEVFAASVLTIQNRTLPAQIFSTLGQSSQAYQFAGAFFMLIPSMIFIFFIRRYLFNMWGQVTK